MQTNEIFLLVGEVVARIVTTFLSSTNTDVDGDDGHGDLAAAQAPFVDFVQKHWWDVAVQRGSSLRDTIDENEDSVASSLPDTLRALCEKSSALLRRAFGSLPPALERVLSAEMFGRVVGMFEQNNVGVRAPSPIPTALRELVSRREEGQCVDEIAALLQSVEDEEWECGGVAEDGNEEQSCCDTRDEFEHGKESLVPVVAAGDGREGSDEAIIGGVAEEKLSAESATAVPPPTLSFGAADNDAIEVLKRAAAEHDEHPDEMFVPLDGTALYSLICCMNHSCRPNCMVRYPGRRGERRGDRADPLVAQVVLLEDVEAGVELTQSYIDRELGLRERRDALEDYGFLCRCSRCTEEEASTV